MEQVLDGPTPHGGAKAIAYFRDADGNPSPKERAAQVEIVELDAAGEQVFRTHGYINGYTANKFCATGKGGGVDPSCGKEDKSSIAKASAKRVDAEIQRYAEEFNEPLIATALGGYSLKDNEPADVVLVRNGKVRHGIELKTMVDNGNDKITMKREAMEKKAAWERKNRATMHTVVLDDRDVFNANGPGKHDFSKRRILYRRGYGSFRTGNMHEAGSTEELKVLLDTPRHKLPEKAR